MCVTSLIEINVHHYFTNRNRAKSVRTVTCAAIKRTPVLTILVFSCLPHIAPPSSTNVFASKKAKIQTIYNKHIG